MRQKQNDFPNGFYERVIHILNPICNYIDLHAVKDNEKLLNLINNKMKEIPEILLSKI